MGSLLCVTVPLQGVLPIHFLVIRIRMLRLGGLRASLKPHRLCVVEATSVTAETFPSSSYHSEH